MIGDGIGNLLGLAFDMIKPAIPKIASTIGLSGSSAGVSHGINKATILLPMLASIIISALIKKEKELIQIFLKQN